MTSSAAAVARRNSPIRTVFFFLGSVQLQALLASAYIASCNSRSSFSGPSSFAFSTNKQRRATASRPLFAVAEFEEVMKDKDHSSNSNDDEDSWIPTKGGFFPKILQRPQTPQRQRDITEVKTMQDYKSIVVDEKSQMVAVFFYAPWCRACKAVHGRYRKLAREYDTVKFVQVPLTPDNGFLHEGLGVPSLPFSHIYHPTAGLVEERKINKHVFKEFQDVLDDYVKGQCQIDWDVVDVMRNEQAAGEDLPVTNELPTSREHQVDYEEGMTLM
jgi:thiol-disulfide isomerase/thioredoxin